MGVPVLGLGHNHMLFIVHWFLLLLVGRQEVSLVGGDRVAGVALWISDAQVLRVTIPALFCQVTEVRMFRRAR